MFNNLVLFLLVFLFPSFVQSQQSVLENIFSDNHFDLALTTDVGNSENTDYDGSFSSHSVQNVKLFVQRNGSEVLCNISNPNNLTIEKLYIERKTSTTLSAYKTIRTLNSSELESINLNGKVIVNDKYP